MSKRKHHRDASPAIHVVVATAVLASALALPLIAPRRAEGETLAELSDRIADIENQMREREEVVESTKASLMDTVREAYKTGDRSPQSALSFILASGDMDALLSKTQYADAMSRKYVHEIAVARDARAELEGTRDELDALRKELEARRDSMANADDGKFHYCQWGEPYSSIRYYCGTIGSAGCGLCCYTSVVNILNGTSYDIPTMLATRGDWMGEEGLLDGYAGTPGGMTHHDWTLDHFGIESERIPPTVEDARAALEGGESCLILCTKGTVFHDKAGAWRWSSGHFVCVYRCDDNGFYVHDPSYQGDNGTAVFYSDAEAAEMFYNANNLVRYHK